MAFSNLWSSERLSFSLSIIAVISAAITTFLQFHKSTEINCIVHLVEHFPSATDRYRHDTLSFSCSFLNSGSTPVGLIDSRIFLANDAGLEKQSSLIGDVRKKTPCSKSAGVAKVDIFLHNPWCPSISNSLPIRCNLSNSCHAPRGLKGILTLYNSTLAFG